MTDVLNMRRESIDLEALLLSRAYLYMLFHKLFGGTPDAAMVACVLSETTRDVVEEYAGDDPSMKGLGRFLENLGECVDGAVLTEQARDEYTRLFIGPGEGRRRLPGEHSGRACHLSRARASTYAPHAHPR